MSHEGKLSGEHPPFARKRQIAALHLIQRYVLAAYDLRNVFAESTAQGTLALCKAPRRFTNINQLLLEIESIDPAERWTDAFG